MVRKTRLVKPPEETTFHRFAYELGQKTPIQVESDSYNSFRVPLKLVEANAPYISEFIAGLTIADVIMNGETPDLVNNPQKTLETRIHLAQVAPQIVLFEGTLHGKIILSDGNIVYKPNFLHSPNPETDYIVGKTAAFMYAQHLGFTKTKTRFDWLINGKREKRKTIEILQEPVLTFFKVVWKRKQGMHGILVGTLKLPLFLVADIQRAIPLYTGDKKRKIKLP